MQSQTQTTKLTKLNLPNQTKPTKPNLPNQTYSTEPTKSNLPNQNYWLKHSTPGSVVPLAMFFLQTIIRNTPTKLFDMNYFCHRHCVFRSCPGSIWWEEFFEFFYCSQKNYFNSLNELGQIIFQVFPDNLGLTSQYMQRQRNQRGTKSHQSIWNFKHVRMGWVGVYCWYWCFPDSLKPWEI